MSIIHFTNIRRHGAPPEGDQAPSAGRLRIGAGVWLREPDGVTLSRAQIIGFERFAGRWLVVLIDNPRRQIYVGAHRLLPRFVGEIAPGRDLTSMQESLS